MQRVSSANRLSSGRYDIREHLAAGGMGVIYRAYDRLAGREVAYKRLVIVNESSRARLTQLFQREYNTLARLAHPNIVETFDYGNDEEGPYYTMELLAGRDLTAAAPLPYREACAVLRDVASALALVHARRLVHRDVSPANVRLASDGSAKLIDFGALTPFGKPEELVGTPSCMAPECLAHAPLDQRADLYSLGAVAYWVLTQQTAIRARKVAELTEAWKEPIAAPSLLSPGIPPELDALVLSLLAQDPLARPASAAYVIDRLTTIGELPAQADERRIAYSYLAHPPLSGRSEPLALLQRGLASAEAGQGNVTLVDGQAGLGRTALLDALSLRAQLDGFVVLRASGSRSAGAFGLARELTDFAYLLYHDLTPLHTKGQSILLPQGKGQSASEVAARHASVVAMARMTLLELSRRNNPVALVVDDLHASDPESLALLASLLRELGTHRIALIASTQGGHAGEGQAAHSLIREQAERVALAPLSEDQLVELVRSVFGDVPNTLRLGQWLHAQSGGNPATAMDLARLLLERGDIRYTLGTFTLPHTLDAHVSTGDLAQAVLARLGNLGSNAHSVARTLSLHEGILTPEQLATVLELSLRDVLLALEELGGRGVVTQRDEGFALTAASLRGALEQQLSRPDKQALHVRLAQALLSHGSGLTEASFHAGTHLLQAGREEEAAEIVAALGRGGLNGESAARWVVLIEAVLAVFSKQRRSKEQHLALLIPLMHAGFYGQMDAQRRHIGRAVAWMSQVCGMALARRLRPLLGGRLSLMLGISYASLRRALTPAKRRLGSIPAMLGEFVGLVCAGTAAAVIADDVPAAMRWNQALEPLAALPPHTGGYLLREFCLATVEAGEGNFNAARSRYDRLMPALLSPIPGLDDALRLTIYRGCLNGRAQAELHEVNSNTLALAEELGQGDPFFAPHSECLLMGYHGYRGDRVRAEQHRVRAEQHALSGGNSWSAEAIIAKRGAMTSILTRDPIGLVQTIAHVERLLVVAPNMQRLKVFCEAWLEALRGHPERGVELYRSCIEGNSAALYHTWRFDRACYAALLNATGQHVRAREVCEEVLRGQSNLADLKELRQFALQQLALAEAGLGRIAEGVRLMDIYLASARRFDNPLLLGDAHRDRAYIALLGADRAGFEEHLEAMTAHYRTTGNPSLIQQCEALSAQAVARGLRAALTPTGMPIMDLGSTTVMVVSADISSEVFPEVSGVRVASSAANAAQQDERDASNG